jgi:hypothetical protein
MRNLFLYAATLAGCVVSLSPSPCAGQALPKFGLGVKASTLGVGIEAATAVTRKSNVRIGVNAFDYSHNFTQDGINYNGKLILRSVELLYDQYLIGGFHISSGLLAYNHNRGTATEVVPGGSSFTLGGTTFYSDRNNPVNGSGTVTLGKAAPMVLLGFGNLLPRSTRHFAVNFEFGVVFQGSPDAKLNLNGSTCNSLGTACQAIGSNADAQSHITAEQQKLNDKLAPFKYYPVVSLGFGYKF